MGNKWKQAEEERLKAVEAEALFNETNAVLELKNTTIPSLQDELRLLEQRKSEESLNFLTTEVLDDYRAQMSSYIGSLMDITNEFNRQIAIEIDRLDSIKQSKLDEEKERRLRLEEQQAAMLYAQRMASIPNLTPISNQIYQHPNNNNEVRTERSESDIYGDL